jgi:hypothetical protein
MWRAIVLVSRARHITTAGGYVYRTLYPRADLVARIAEELGAGNRFRNFTGAVLSELAAVVD